MLIDRGHLRHDGAAAGGSRPTASLPVPESVQGLIAARLDDLPADQKQLLQDAAVLGKVVWLGALAADERREPVRGRGAPARGSSAARCCGASAARRSAARSSTPSGTCSCATSPTARSRAPSAPRSTGARRSGSSRSRPTARTPRTCSPTTTRRRSSTRATRVSPTAELERRTRLALRDAAERAAALNSFDAALRSLPCRARAVAGGRPGLADAGRRRPRTSASASTASG